MIYKLLFFLNCLSPLLIKAQTCILIVSRNDTIIIGADSKVGVISFIADSSGVKMKTPFYNRNDCKILKEKEVFYVASGRWAGNFLKYGREIIIKQVKFRDTINYLIEAASLNLETELEKCNR